MGLAGRPNTYLYVRANPLRWSDPYGLYPNCISTILGISQYEWDEVDRSIITQFDLPVPIPNGVNIGPDPGAFPAPPVGPEMEFNLWEVQYTLAFEKTYKVKQVVQHLLVVCTEKRKGPCGRTHTFRTSFHMDKALDPIRTLIANQLNWSYRLIRLLGHAGFGF